MSVTSCLEEKKNPPELPETYATKPNNHVVWCFRFRGAAAGENKLHKHFIGSHGVFGLPITTVHILKIAAAES